ncbi:Transmembrane amino acid transporter protein [Tritrichomonas foetus]|uniref:Transmembrane amino acid transporter protein n=1 Tax=Tritrichomonas foetus TaxID=1144522 RepID=A0A1J4K125_9EUKA|nr:Transmembrane amino acid transporter protein [Tritrichomonas foetus]|eukprot:OHT05129.1 Transmembrane amino acid transporter protein [Tritrichomonas foetus]
MTFSISIFFMFGGDLRVSDFRFQAQTKERNFVLFPPAPTKDRISMFTAVMFLLKIGIASDPFMSSQNYDCGIIQAFLLCFALLLLMQLSIHLYIKCWFFGAAYNYTDLFSIIFGHRFRFIPIFLNVAIFSSFIIWHTYEIYHNLQLFIIELWPSSSSFLTNKWFLSYFINSFTLIPIILVKRLTHLKFIAYAGNISVLVAMICAISIFYHQYMNNETMMSQGKQMKLFSSDLKSSLECINSFNEAFFIHSMIQLIFCDMNNPTISRCLGATWIQGIISAFVHFIGYLICTFASTDRKEMNFFYNFDPHLPEVFCGRIATYIITITSSQIYTYYLSTQLSAVVFTVRTFDAAPVFILGMNLIFLTIGLNFISELIITIFDFVASVGFVFLIYVFPCVFYLKLYRFSRPVMSFLAIFLMVIGIPLSAVLMYFSLTFHL